MPSLQVESAHPGELAPALRLVLRRFDAENVEGRVRRALALVADGELPADGILVVRAGSVVAGAIVCIPLPGSSGLVWAPQAADWTESGPIEDALVRAGLIWLRQRGAKLAQAFLYPDEAPLGEPLLRNGFHRVTRLLYLRRPADDTSPADTRTKLTCQTYREADSALFRRTLLRSYEQTLDCPELNGVRTVEEIVEGHKAQGAFDPDRWCVALLDGRPVGVLIVNPMPELDGWDLAYLGVVPEARGCGIGLALTTRVLAEARAAGTSQLMLAVDARNLPARHLYARLGFEFYDERDVYLAFYPRER